MARRATMAPATIASAGPIYAADTATRLACLKLASERNMKLGIDISQIVTLAEEFEVYVKGG